MTLTTCFVYAMHRAGIGEAFINVDKRAANYCPVAQWADASKECLALVGTCSTQWSD
ncbi:hypothetical protein GGI05_005091 [Coemansia sp. RSA 2603]|nr:hypothetical protein GGI05_005091 [Coemansia sp. RSA 2603]